MPTTQTCQHIFPDAHRCGSPALRTENFCYFHHPSRTPVADPYARRARRGFDLAAPTNRREVQLALSQILTRVAANKLDVRRAGLILYSLHLVSQSFTV